MIDKIKSTKKFLSALSHKALVNILTVLVIGGGTVFAFKKDISLFINQQKTFQQAVISMDVHQKIIYSKLDSISKYQQILAENFNANANLNTAKLKVVAWHISEIEKDNDRIFLEFEEIKEMQRFWTSPTIEQRYKPDSIKIGVREWRKK